MNRTLSRKHIPVALLVESSRAYGRGLLRGISAYAQSHPSWYLYHSERTLQDGAPQWIQACNARGIIARLESDKLINQIQKMGVPTVDLRALRTLQGIPQIYPNQKSVARLAAEHLMDRGFVNFACCFYAGINYGEQRASHFAAHVSGCGYTSRMMQHAKRSPASTTAAIEQHGLVEQPVLEEWLKTLPKPVGLMAINDFLARQILVGCDRCGILVPEEIAVIGIDNDDIICNLCRPSLTSIQLDTKKMGYEAAALLDRMMAGEAPPDKPLMIEPLAVVERQSTDVTAVSDADVAAALHLIREHACDGIRVSDVCKSLCLSHTTLKRKFARLMNRSPKSEIVRVQINSVKRLLAMTEYQMEEVAQRTGFSYVGHMCTVFRKITGETPSHYRQEMKAKS